MITQLPLPCVHHWKLSEPDGPYAESVCQLCGETKTECNVHFEDRPRYWHESKHGERAREGARKAKAK